MGVRVLTELPKSVITVAGSNKAAENSAENL